MEKLIITAALIGNTTTREKNPNPPITPKEIAESAIESYHAGAAVCHVHVRDPITQAPSMNFELYREIFERIREKCDMVINLTTGAGGRLFCDPTGRVWDTSGLKTPEERVDHVIRLKPEICSLDIGTMNMGRWAFINMIPIVEKMSALIREARVKPELEVFDVGHICIAEDLVRKGLVDAPSLFQLCLGIKGPESGGKGLDEKINSFEEMIGRVQKAYPNASYFGTTLREVVSADCHLWGALVTDGKDWEIVKPRQIGVFDRIGGGDGFVGGFLYGILKGWDVKKCARFGWASGALAATMLTDYAQPADEDQIWSIWDGNARVQR